MKTAENQVKKLLKRIEKLENNLHNLETLMKRYVESDNELLCEDNNPVDDKTAKEMFENYNNNFRKNNI